MKNKHILDIIYKAKVFEKCNYSCVKCNTSMEKTELQIDHIIARTLGGIDDPSNMQLLCKYCHKRKTKNDLHKKSLYKQNSTKRKNHEKWLEKFIFRNFESLPNSIQYDILPIFTKPLDKDHILTGPLKRQAEFLEAYELGKFKPSEFLKN